MKLEKLVRDKIKKLGATKAAAYFGVSVPTIYSWKKKSPPISAVQKVMDEQPKPEVIARDTNTSIETETEVPEPSAEVASEVVSGEQAPDSVEARLDRIEQAIRGLTDPARRVPLTSGVHPFRNPESGITTTSKAEVIEGQPDRKPEAAVWNRPVNPAPKEQGWNAPISKVEGGRNPADGWNKPVPKE